MKIAVDFRVKKNFSPSVKAFLEQLWFDLARLEPGHDFCFLRKEAPADGAHPGKIEDRLIKLTGFGWLGQKRLLKTLTEYRADAYIRFEEDGFSVITPAKKGFVKKDLQDPPVKIVFSQYRHLQLQQAPNTTTVVHSINPVMPDIVSSLSWAEAESIKTQYTGGRDFFFFNGDIDEHCQLMELLKAFSSFKKWQQSNMQLVIAGYPTSWTPLFEEKLSSYKYRHDVVLLKKLLPVETAKLLAASYAALYTAMEKTLPLSFIQAIQCGVAVIACDNPANRQLTGAACWIGNSHLQEDFAKAMILLYKDESRKIALVQKAKEEAKRFNRGQMLGEVWECIKQK
jgi:glycosyltransferase involved in cell wall biosynthesis